jgi:hypothetical protein
MQNRGVLDNGAKFAISFVYTVAREALRRYTTGPALTPSTALDKPDR